MLLVNNVQEQVALVTYFYMFYNLQERYINDVLVDSYVRVPGIRNFTWLVVCVLFQQYRVYIYAPGPYSWPTKLTFPPNANLDAKLSNTVVDGFAYDNCYSHL